MAGEVSDPFRRALSPAPEAPVLLSAVPTAYADSPLTSIDLAAAYPEVQTVATARKRGLPKAVAAFLLGDAPLDRKVALVNTLGWTFDGQDHATALATEIARRHHLGLAELSPAALAPEEQLLLGYTLAMDHYLDLGPMVAGAPGVRGASPIALVDAGAAGLPASFSAQLVRALVHAQADMQGPWCEVWRDGERVLDAFPPERRDLRPAAVAAAVDYLSLYRDECPQPPPPSVPGTDVPQDPGLDQIYDVTGWHGLVVTGAQQGVVLWKADGDTLRPVAARTEFICGTVLPVGDDLIAGCYHTVLRYDGTTWTTLVEDKDSDELFQPVLAPDGHLWVVHGSETWAWDGQALKRSGRALSGYDVLFRRDGTAWSVAFMDAIVGPDGSYAVKSAVYPGADPRSLAEDPFGRLWVMDFESGFYRLDGGRFVALAGGPKNASDVAFDAVGRTWLLEYQAGLWLVEGNAAPRHLDIDGLGYARAVWIDADGDAWVGTGAGLVRVDGRTFGVTRGTVVGR